MTRFDLAPPTPVQREALIAGLSADEKLNANQIVARLQSRHPLTKREIVRLEPDAGRMHVFSNKTGDRIS